MTFARPTTQLHPSRPVAEVLSPATASAESRHPSHKLPHSTAFCANSVDGKYERAAGPSAGATQIFGIPARSAHRNIHRSRTRDLAGCKLYRQLFIADNVRAQNLPVDDNFRGRNKIAAVHVDQTSLLYLGKSNCAGHQ